jgi:hypothetical protein
MKLLLHPYLPLRATGDRNCASVIRFIAFGFAILVSSGIATAQKSIRQVDFKNFTYPLSGTLLGHDRLQWLRVPSAAHPGGTHINLVNGSDLSKSPSVMGREDAQLEGFSFQSVQFADLTGGGSEDAIVVLRYHTGGTQSTDYVYIYSFQGGEPRLLEYCYTGDRAYSGLYKVYGDRGMVVFDLFDPRKRSADCCSSGLVRIHYRWHKDRFEAFGPREFRTVKEP